MKSIILSVLYSLLTTILLGQSVVCGYYKELQLTNSTENAPPLFGYQTINHNTADNSVGIVASPQAGRTINHIGLNKSKFLYSVEGVFNQGYNIISYNTQSDFTSVVAKTKVYWDGGIDSDAKPSGMAVDNNDLGWVIAYSVVNGKNYLTSFKTSNTGTVSNLSTVPFVLNTNLESIQITDIVFDKYNNLYAIVVDMLLGYQYIYYADASTIANAASGSEIVLSMKWQITNESGVPIVFSPKFYEVLPNNFAPFDSYLANGLAFGENGYLLIGVDKMHFNSYNDKLTGQGNNYIYAFRFRDAATPSVQRSIVASSPPNMPVLGYCDDLASNYFPVFIPFTFGEISAAISNNMMKVLWQTHTERNAVKFNIGISKDGVSFTNIQSINTKAQDGNSNTPLQYDFNYDLGNAPRVVAISIAFFLLSCGAFVKNNRVGVTVLVITTTCFMMIGGCGKKDAGIKTSAYTGKVFVKITAIDKDGFSISSKTVQAIR